MHSFSNEGLIGKRVQVPLLDHYLSPVRGLMDKNTVYLSPEIKNYLSFISSLRNLFSLAGENGRGEGVEIQNFLLRINFNKAHRTLPCLLFGRHLS